MAEAKKQPKLKVPTYNSDRALKERIGRSENQATFWRRLGVTQSGGSRYESGRNPPKAVRMLMALEAGTAAIDDLRQGRLAEAV